MADIEKTSGFYTHDAGHSYELANMQGGKTQTLEFIKKEAGETIVNGTTTETVLEVLIDRMEFLQRKLPCVENVATIKLLKLALEIQNLRTEGRKNRGVEGTDQA